MAPNEGSIALTNLIISSLSFIDIQSGNAFTLPRVLNKTAFPSITGNAPSGPISPSPRTLVPSHTIAILFHFEVYSYANSLFFWISIET